VEFFHLATEVKKAFGIRFLRGIAKTEVELALRTWSFRCLVAGEILFVFPLLWPPLPGQASNQMRDITPL